MLIVAGLLGLALTVAPGPWFVDATPGSGIPSLRHGEGVNAVDVNCDGLTDLYLPCVRERGRLLLNREDVFEDVTELVGLVEKGGVGAAVGDLNNDALPDIYVARGADPYVAPNLVYLQQQDGTFVDASSTLGVSEYLSGISVMLADLTGNGYRDVFLPGWGNDLFFKNKGHAKFFSVAKESGFTHDGRGWSALTADFDNDGNLDVFATYGSYAEPRDNHLYRNLGNGNFVDITEAAGLALSPWSLGAVSADFDNDGDFDLYVTGYGGKGKLFRNEGGARFTDVTKDSGLSAAKSVGATAGQIDNDLLQDIVVGGFGETVRVYKNLGNMKFAEVGELAGLQEFKRNEGLTLADLDNDGDLDLYVSNVEGNNRYYKNTLNSRDFLKIRFGCIKIPLEGTVARLSRDGQLLAVQHLAGVVGLGQGPYEFLFRLPDDGLFDLELILPDGRKVEKKNLPPGVLQVAL